MPSSFVDVLSFNDPVNAGLSFNNNTSGGLSILGVKTTLIAQSTGFTSTNYFGNWHGQFDKYLGLKFTIGANTHYGWIRMDVTADCDSIIIKDYAYHTIPNQGILAGQTLVSVEEHESAISVYIYQQSLYISRNINEQEQMQLFSLDGKLIFEKELQNENEIISLTGIPQGIYLVRVGNEVKKIKI